MAGRRVASTAWMRLARAVGHARAQRHLALADFLDEKRDEQPQRERDGDKNGEQHCRTSNPLETQRLCLESISPKPMGRISCRAGALAARLYKDEWRSWL